MGEGARTKVEVDIAEPGRAGAAVQKRHRAYSTTVSMSEVRASAGATDVEIEAWLLIAQTDPQLSKTLSYSFLEAMLHQKYVVCP